MATKSLGQLTLDLIARIGGYTGPLDKAERKTKESTSNMAKYAKGAGVVLAGMGVTAASGLAVLVKSSINTADELSKASKIVGIAIEDLSGLKHAADLSGVGFDGLQTGLVKLNRSTQEAIEGIGAGSDAYRALGINVKNTDGTLKTNYELLGEISDAFAGMQDGATKTSIAQDLLGKSGAKLIPLLNGGAKGLQDFREEAERLGLVIDQETGTASEEFNDNMARLQKTLIGLGNKVAADVAPILAEFTDTLADPETQEGISSLIEGFIEGAKVAAGFASELGSIYRLLNGFDENNLGQINEQIEAVKSAIQNPSERLRFFGKDGLVEYYSEDELKVEMEKLLAQRDKIISDHNKNSPKLNSTSGSQAGFSEYNNAGIDAEINAQLEQRYKIQAGLYQQADELSERFASSEAAYKRQIELAYDATEVDKLHFEIANGALKGISEAQALRLEGLAEQIDKNKQLIESEKAVADLRKEFSAIHEQALESGGKLIDLENYRSQLQREALQKEMDELKEKGAWTAEIEAEAQQALEEQEQAHQDRLKAIRDQADADELKRKQIQLAGAESLFESLGSLTEAFGEKNSRMRKAFLIAEKAAAVASSTIAISTAIASASDDLPFPANLGAMATIASETAGILTTIKGVNIAHGGLDFVPEETTYLLDKGERVVSPRQNEDLTNFLAGAKVGNGGGVRIDVINQLSAPIDVRGEVGDDGRIRLIINAVKQDLRKDLGNGAGIWREAKEKYNWTQKGKI